MPGSTPATSQLDWLSSTTAMIVLSWSKATRDLLKSFIWGIGALRQLFAERRWCHLLAACPIPSLRWREKDSNPRSPGYGELGALARATRDHAAMVKPGAPDRSRRRTRRAICGTPGAHLSSRCASASRFAFSATFEICRGDRIVGRANAQIADESGIP